MGENKAMEIAIWRQRFHFVPVRFFIFPNLPFRNCFPLPNSEISAEDGAAGHLPRALPVKHGQNQLITDLPMKCPYCNFDDTRVVDSREISDGRTIRRRRECPKCKERFSTYEKVALLNLTVIKKNKKKEEYKKEKIEDAIRIASNKRLNDDEIADVVAEIESEIHAKGKCEIQSKEIGEIALRKIKQRDEVAYLRFASVFKSFGSGKRFLKELNKLEKKS
jgi:transcriptional repressor NrdR